eukprot:CAMPEP_0113675758 /NCGR_PEP_ID=MMETSP0038_2-20120614/8215_1 /TAXON_ID=2898 /ORGANISM="Cryptomonas paramecium" /LENGTH=100 /DNA_ID=CAMNT_0000592611 /DNA_START=77 /DNA_END=379 /DNA_ORIENTATION=- /assembly_acc=CAM_ASM_000170
MTRQACLADLVDEASPVADSLGIEVPEDFFCPITLDIMRDPVIGTDGRTYDCTAIVAWLSKHRRSPLTNLPMGSENLRPNEQMRKEIEEWSTWVIRTRNS